MHRFPRRSILLIALLDTLSLVVMVVAGASTPPVLSVLLMQATIPFIILLSSCPSSPSFPSPFPSLTAGRGKKKKTKRFKEEHWQGGGLILLGIAVAMAPAVHAAFWHGHRDIGKDGGRVGGREGGPSVCINLCISSLSFLMSD